MKFVFGWPIVLLFDGSLSRSAASPSSRRLGVGAGGQNRACSALCGAMLTSTDKHFQDTCTATCDTGWKPQGGTSFTCGANGQFTGSLTCTGEFSHTPFRPPAACAR